MSIFAFPRLGLAVEQPLPLLLCLLHGPEEQDVQDDQGNAGDQVHEQDAEPAEGIKERTVKGRVATHSMS